MTRTVRATAMRLMLTLVALVALVAPTRGQTRAVTVPQDRIDDPSLLGELRQGQPGACTTSTRAVLRSCRHQVEDDYWEAVGRCLNLADATEREACLAEAAAARSEAAQLCDEQYVARTEVCELLGEAPYDPQVLPGNFRSPEDAATNPNPYFPLVPGMRWKYVSGDQVTDVNVTDDVKEILGVRCFVVKDVVRDLGVVIEDTEDWYAMDQEGNVWYFGELSLGYEEGELTTIDGSWKSGRDGASPGIIMKASPEVGDAYRQEFMLGEVEDLGQVLSITGTESVPAASCNGDCVVTKDFAPVEPDVVEHKYYARGVGTILEVDPETGEREELVEFDSPTASFRVGGLSSPSGAATFHVDSQTLPNPFRVETAIRFSLPRAADVDAEVYDAAGRRVRLLTSGPHVAGEHTLRWDGTDSDGRRAAAGIYFVRVKAGDQVQSRKVVLVQ